jgi:hypothetical protein
MLLTVYISQNSGGQEVDVVERDSLFCEDPLFGSYMILYLLGSHMAEELSWASFIRALILEALIT